MRLKEIKPVMVIHCKNISEYERLEEETIKNGYGELPLHNRSEDFIKKVVFYIHDEKSLWGGLNENYIEFSDLIMPELTAEEAIEWLSKHYRDEEWIKCFGRNYCMDEIIQKFGTDNVISKIAQWRADNEKKEPEIETVGIFRIIEIQPNGRKRYVHEEYINLPFDGYERQKIEEILKRYCMEHDGEFIAVHEVVSRVKR